MHEEFKFSLFFTAKDVDLKLEDDNIVCYLGCSNNI